MYMLIITNPHYFTYTADELLIELLGGIRIDTLPRFARDRWTG